MASPQLEHGFTKIANEIGYAFCRSSVVLSHYEWKCIWFIIMKTYGWRKKVDWISISQFSEGTGISRQHVCRTMKKLVNKGLIAKTIAQSGNAMYSFQKNHEMWGIAQLGNVTQSGNVPEQATLPNQVVPNQGLPNQGPTKETTIHIPIEHIEPNHKTELEAIITFFNETCNTHYTFRNEEINGLIRGRIKDGFKVEDFKKVIKVKFLAWGNDEKMCKYLRPNTLFRPSHFESYLNEKDLYDGIPESLRHLIKKPVPVFNKR